MRTAVRLAPSFLSVTLLLLLAFPQAGCGEDDDVDFAGSALIRVVHASPDAPAVDIYIDVDDGSEALFTSVDYGDVTDYVEVDAGARILEVRPAGAPEDSEPVFATNVDIFGDTEITTIAAGLLMSNDDSNRFRMLPLVEGFADPPEGNAIVRIVHAAPDAPDVAIDVGNDGTPEITDLGRFLDSGAAGVSLPAGEELQIGILAGDPLEPVTAFTTPMLPDGAEIFMVAGGLLGERPSDPRGFSILALSSAGPLEIVQQNPVIQALHASPDAPPVDIFSDDSILAAELAFGDLSEPIQVAPGRYTLDFFPAGTGPGVPAASAGTPELLPGDRYLAIAGGFLTPIEDEAPFQLLTYIDELAKDPDNARLRIIHASPDAPAVDVAPVLAGNMQAPLFVEAAEFSDATAGEGVAVEPGSVLVGVAATGEPTPLVSFEVTSVPGLRGFAIAAGALTPAEDEEEFRLLLVVTSTFPWTVTTVMPTGM